MEDLKKAQEEIQAKTSQVKQYKKQHDQLVAKVMFVPFTLSIVHVHVHYCMPFYILHLAYSGYWVAHTCILLLFIIPTLPA